MKADRAQVTRLLKTARGQLDGILKMVEEDRYCLEISTQLMAAQSILKKANRLVLAAHMDSCVREAVEYGDPGEKLEELALLLGMHRTTLTRILCRLREMNVLGRFTRHQLLILDRARLEELAGKV